MCIVWKGVLFFSTKSSPVSPLSFLIGTVCDSLGILDVLVWSQAESCCKAALVYRCRTIVKVSKDVSFGPVLNVPWVSALKKFIGIKKAFCHYWLIIQVVNKLASLFLSFMIMMSKKRDSKRGNGQRKQNPKKRKDWRDVPPRCSHFKPWLFLCESFFALYGDLKRSFKSKFPISWMFDVVIKWIEDFPAEKVLH